MKPDEQGEIAFIARLRDRDDAPHGDFTFSNRYSVVLYFVRRFWGRGFRKCYMPPRLNVLGGGQLREQRERHPIVSR